MNRRTENTVIGAVGGSAAIAVSVYTLYKAGMLQISKGAGGNGQTAKVTLTIVSGTGGTTNPSGSKTLSVNESITLTATPNTGYDFLGWFIAGKLYSFEPTVTYKIAVDTVISAAFTQQGQPQLIPTYITPFEKIKIALTHRWRLYKTSYYSGIGLFIYDEIHIVSDFHEVNGVAFKLCDKNGNGVPDQKIAVYTDNMPDITGFGALVIKDVEGTNEFGYHPLGEPIILTTDVHGVVVVTCAYNWAENEDNQNADGIFKDTLGRSGKLRASCLLKSDIWVLPFGNHERSPTYYYIPPFPAPPIPIPQFTAWVEWVRLLDPIYRTSNLIHAYWVDNPNLLNMGVCSADCSVTIMGNTTPLPTG
jgi:hypothetical protein